MRRLTAIERLDLIVAHRWIYATRVEVRALWLKRWVKHWEKRP